MHLGMHPSDNVGADQFRPGEHRFAGGKAALVARVPRKEVIPRKPGRQRLFDRKRVAHDAWPRLRRSRELPEPALVGIDRAAVTEVVEEAEHLPARVYPEEVELAASPRLARERLVEASHEAAREGSGLPPALPSIGVQTDHLGKPSQGLGIAAGPAQGDGAQRLEMPQAAAKLRTGVAASRREEVTSANRLEVDERRGLRSQPNRDAACGPAGTACGTPERTRRLIPGTDQAAARIRCCSSGGAPCSTSGALCSM